MNRTYNLFPIVTFLISVIPQLSFSNCSRYWNLTLHQTEIFKCSPNWNLFNYLLLTMIYALSVSKTFATFIDDASIREIMLSGVSGYILTLRVPISMYSL